MSDHNDPNKEASQIENSKKAVKALMNTDAAFKSTRDQLAADQKATTGTTGTGGQGSSEDGSPKREILPYGPKDPSQGPSL